jgi:hypothetical protein
MRAGFTAVCPHPGPLPEGEGEKQYALFGGRISNLVKLQHKKDEAAFYYRFL